MSVIKIPQPKKLPSGNWRVQFQIEGQRYSVTGETKTEAKEKADQKTRMILAGIEDEKKSPFTVGKAIDKYIEEKAGVLSPSTIRGYKTYRKIYFQDLMNINLTSLTNSDIQLAVNSEVASGKSAKTVKNAHGLLTATLRDFRPNFSVHTKLPQKQKKEERILTESEIQKVWKEAKGTDYELPILLASWLGLRISEIRGLQFGDIKNGRIHVHRAIVPDEFGNDVVKGPKTISGDRWIKLPKTIADLIDEKKKAHPKYKTKEISEQYICLMTRNAIYEGFVRKCKKAGVEPCRFHDLRHFAASEGHSLGVPDKYLEKRIGHSTDNMLKTIYEHTMREKEDLFGDLIDSRMEELFKSAHENAHEN